MGLVWRRVAALFLVLFLLLGECPALRQGLSAAGEWEVRLAGTPHKLDVRAASPGLLCLPKWGNRMLRVGGSAK